MKLIIFRLAWFCGLFAIFDFLNRKALRIYSYHGVIPDGSHKISGMDFHESILRRQLSLLNERYGCERLDVLMHNISGKVAVTFDDGCMSDYTRVNPLLRELNIRATFFVCSDLIEGTKTHVWTDLAFLMGLPKMLDAKTITENDVAAARKNALAFEEQVRDAASPNPYSLLNAKYASIEVRVLRKLAEEVDAERLSALSAVELSDLIAAGHIIGCHTKSHPILRHIEHDADALIEEVADSRSRLELLIGEPVMFFAYPFGGHADVGAATINAACDAGYRAAFLNVESDNKCRFAIGRSCLPHSAEPFEVFAYTSGFVYFLKNRRLLPRPPKEITEYL